MEGRVSKMSKVIIKRLLALFLVTILISGCSETSASDEINEEDLAEVEVEQEEPLQVAFTDSRLEEMIGIVENEYLRSEERRVGKDSRYHRLQEEKIKR